MTEMVSVPAPRGMRKPLEMIGARLLAFYRDRFALAQPVQHTDNERQVLVAALELLKDALSARPEALPNGVQVVLRACRTSVEGRAVQNRDILLREIDALLSPPPLEDMRITQNDKRWRLLEHGCQWVSWTPIGGETHSFDPRDVEYLKRMRAWADETIEKQLAILRAGISAPSPLATFVAAQQEPGEDLRKAAAEALKREPQGDRNG